MKVWHCTKCHHEWETSEYRNCDWCGAKSKVIAEKPDWHFPREIVQKLKNIFCLTP